MKDIELANTMDLSLDFLLYATIFRVAVVAAAVLIIVLGYRLFVRGVTSQGGTDAAAEAGEFKLTIKNAAPGTCFALFGAAMISVMIVEGSPKLDIQSRETRQGASAQEESARSVSLRAESSDAPLLLSGTSASHELMSEAIAALDELVAIGAKRELAGDLSGAIDAYNRALSLPEVPLRHAAAPLNQIAWIHLQEGRLDEALPLAKLAVRITPESSAYLDTLAQLRLKRGEHDEALRLARRAVELSPSDAELLHTLALCLEAVGSEGDALQTMEQAARLDPRYSSELEQLRRRAP